MPRFIRFPPILAYTWPLLVILILLGTYLWNRIFFVTYIFQINQREFQLVEILTFLSAILAGYLLCCAAWRLWKKHNYWATSLVGVVGLATIFFAGEEISWGQSYLQWSTPSWWNAHFSAETNIHNSQLPIHQLAALFIFAVFFLLPFAWKFRNYFNLPLGLQPAIAEGPVISALAIAVLFRELKGTYRAFAPLWYREIDIPWVEVHDTFYQEFLWGMNEYREMLVALALLLYATYRLRAAKNFPSPG